MIFDDGRSRRKSCRELFQRVPKASFYNSKNRSASVVYPEALLFFFVA
jgi:hypothetical protein